MKAIISYLVLILCLFPTGAQANNPLNLDQEINNLFSQEPEFLPVDQAFQFDFRQDGDKLKLVWTIADEYYLYKSKFKIAARDAQLGELQKPKGRDHEDEYYGLQEVYYQQALLTVPVHSASDGAVVKIRYQGCAEAGLCYPPQTKEIFLNAVAGVKMQDAPAANTASSTNDAELTSQLKLQDAPAAKTASSTNDAEPTLQLKLKALLESDSLLIPLLTCFALGLGLAFTPCVFPMYPILSGIIVGQGKEMTLKRGFSLSFAYVQGMALTYSILGLIVASAGAQFQAAFQHPAILIGLSLLFVVLALSMFGVYELQLPSKWQEKFTNMSNQQKGGNLGGVFAMGALSGLVASPCTTAPLTGVLLYVAQSGDLVFGGLALYILSLGMGLPLLILGTSGGKLLPKAGNWMNLIKTVFGFLLLSVPLVLLDRLLDVFWTQLAIAGLVLSFAIYLQQANNKTQAGFWQGVRSLVIFIALFAGASLGYRTLYPAPQTVVQHSKQAPEIKFVKAQNLEELQQLVAQASAEGKSVMVDLYADWCIACKEFEHKTFPEMEVRQALSNTLAVQVDLTESDATDMQVYEHFNVLGLPTILLFNTQGEELVHRRVTGFMGADEFSAHIKASRLQ